MKEAQRGDIRMGAGVRGNAWFGPLLQLDTGIVHGQLCFSLPQRMQVQLDLVLLIA